MRNYIPPKTMVDPQWYQAQATTSSLAAGAMSAMTVSNAVAGSQTYTASSLGV